MSTITEDYVSFETAKLLKEKVFDEGCHSFYDYAQRLQFIESVIYDSELSEEDNECVAPTLQMAMKWLRDVHNLCIEPYRTACGYPYTISTIPYGSCKCAPKEGGDNEDSCQWTTYDKAYEAAIRYCLENLI